MRIKWTGHVDRVQHNETERELMMGHLHAGDGTEADT